LSSYHFFEKYGGFESAIWISFPFVTGIAFTVVPNDYYPSIPSCQITAKMMASKSLFSFFPSCPLKSGTASSTFSLDYSLVITSTSIAQNMEFYQALLSIQNSSKNDG